MNLLQRRREMMRSKPRGGGAYTMWWKLTYHVEEAGIYRLFHKGYGSSATQLSNEILRLIINGVEQDLTDRPLNYELQAGDNQVLLYAYRSDNYAPAKSYFLCGCSDIVAVEIPPNIVGISSHTLRGLGTLRYLKVWSGAMPTIYNVSFYNTHTDALLVASGLKEDYVADQYWLDVPKGIADNIIDNLDVPYTGFVFSRALSTSNTLSNSNKFCVTPYFPIEMVGTYTWYFGTDSDTNQITVIAPSMEDGVYSDAFMNKTSIDIMQTHIGKFFRLAMYQVNLDDCWVKDPNGKYLFKGLNVK